MIHRCLGHSTHFVYIGIQKIQNFLSMKLLTFHERVAF